ncbi:MAG: hypothetical protein ABFC57_12720 [Veillonellales bacterium]
MDLDRFAYGLPDLQDEPLLGICAHCGRFLYEEALHEDGEVFCDEQCYTEWLERKERDEQYGNA